jgi:hypothetical protein
LESQGTGNGELAITFFDGLFVHGTRQPGKRPAHAGTRRANSAFLEAQRETRMTYENANRTRYWDTDRIGKAGYMLAAVSAF